MAICWVSFPKASLLGWIGGVTEQGRWSADVCHGPKENIAKRCKTHGMDLGGNCLGEHTEICWNNPHVAAIWRLHFLDFTPHTTKIYQAILWLLGFCSWTLCSQELWAENSCKQISGLCFQGLKTMSYIILVSSYFMRAIDFFGSCSGFEMSIPFANNLRTCCIAFFLIAEMDRIRSDEIAKEGQQLRKHYEGTIRALANQTPTTVSFSRMRSKGSRFTLGVWGLRVCSLDVASASATVRNRPQPFVWGPMAVPMGSFAEVVLFGGFRRLVASFRVAGVALRDIQTCSGMCRKSFCLAGAILLLRFQKMCCSFRGRRSTLDVPIVIFRGRRSTLDVSCCVFFVNRIGRAASSGDKVQIPWQAWHFVRCAENWRKPRTKHRFWGFWGCKFSGSKENL